MSVIVLPPTDEAFGKGISQAGSALGQALQQKGLQQRELQLKEAERKRISQSGPILQSLLSSLPANPSIQDVQGIASQAIEKGVDPTVVKQFTDAYAPIFKEQAKTQGAATFLQQVLGQGAFPGIGNLPSTQGTQTTTQGNFYQNNDGVPNNLSQSQIDALIASPYANLQALGKQYDQRRLESRKNFESDRDFHTSGLKKTEDYVSELRDRIPKRERVLQLSRNAITSGDTGALSRNVIANTVGGPIGDALRTKSGADFALAAKENLVTNLGDMSARGQNMFMERRLLDAFAKVGQTNEANLSVQNFFETENKLDKAYLNAYNRLYDEDVARFGYARRDLDKRAREAALPEQQKIFNRSAYEDRRLTESQNGTQWMYKEMNRKVDQGTPLTKEMLRLFLEKTGDVDKAIIRAKQLGYTIYSPSEME